MTSRRQELRERIAEVHTQPGPTRRYGAGLKRAIVAYALERVAEGITHEAIAAELGLARTGLGKWLRHARRRVARGRQPFAPSDGAWPIAAGDEAAPTAGDSPAPERAPEPTPLLLVLRIEEVSIVTDARAQLRAWLATQPEP